VDAGGGSRPLRTAAGSRGRPEEGGAASRPLQAGVGHVGRPPVRPENVPGFASRTGTLEGRPCGPKACFDRDTDRHAEGSPAGVSGIAFVDMHLYLYTTSSGMYYHSSPFCHDREVSERWSPRALVKTRQIF
jgi:hypothetical protein